MSDTSIQHELREAIKLFGTREALAKAIGVSHQALTSWLNAGKRPSPKHILRIFIATKGKINLYNLDHVLGKLMDKAVQYHGCRNVSVHKEEKHRSEDETMKKAIRSNRDKKIKNPYEIRAIIHDRADSICLHGINAIFSEDSNQYLISVNKKDLFFNQRGTTS